MIPVLCPRCRHRFQAPAHTLGRTIPCPACNHDLPIPTAPPGLSSLPKFSTHAPSAPKPPPSPHDAVDLDSLTALAVGTPEPEATRKRRALAPRPPSTPTDSPTTPPVTSSAIAGFILCLHGILLLAGLVILFYAFFIPQPIVFNFARAFDAKSYLLINGLPVRSRGWHHLIPLACTAASILLGLLSLAVGQACTGPHVLARTLPFFRVLMAVCILFWAAVITFAIRNRGLFTTIPDMRDRGYPLPPGDYFHWNILTSLVPILSLTCGWLYLRASADSAGSNTLGTLAAWSATVLFILLTLALLITALATNPVDFFALHSGT